MRASASPVQLLLEPAGLLDVLPHGSAVEPRPPRDLVVAAMPLVKETAVGDEKLAGIQRSRGDAGFKPRLEASIRRPGIAAIPACQEDAPEALLQLANVAPPRVA